MNLPRMKRVILLLVTGIILAVVALSAQAIPSADETPIPVPTLAQPTPTLRRADYVFEAAPGPDVPTLQEMIGDAQTDPERLSAIAAYYEQNRERLSLLWREDDPVRLAGLFSMYVVHVSYVYGPAAFPASFEEYLSQERGHCGTVTYAQWQIAQSLGLTWRVLVADAEHAWLEIQVNGQWEMFDATTNTWINRSGFELLEHAVREYRYFYTPLLDVNRPDARLHLDEGYDMQRLRQRLPTMGIAYFPPSMPYVQFDSSNFRELFPNF